jgi:hypothetical protein
VESLLPFNLKGHEMGAKYLLACLVLVVSSFGGQIASATVYDLVNQGIDPATATGTITTDGTFGVLSQSNITGLDIAVSDGTNSFTLTLPDLQISGADLFATASGLFFNYVGVDGGSLLALNVGSTVNAYCIASAGGLPCFDGGTVSTEGLAVASVAYQGAIQTGEVQIAAVAAIPEVSTWAMMILGFVGVGLMAGRTRNGRVHRSV